MASNGTDGFGQVPSALFQKLGELLSWFNKPKPSIKVYPNAPENTQAPEQTELPDDIKKLGFKDIETLLIFLNSAVKGVNNDKELLLERLIQLLSKLPPNSKNGKKLTDGLITDLWESLDHPPVSSLGSPYQYRSADGSNNSLQNPMLGAAGQHYARSTRPLVFQNPNPPDAATIFDTLMARDPAKFRPHPSQISSMLFYLATIITHDIFQTSSKDSTVNLTSSYLDLSPLYGRNHDEQQSVRALKNGLLKPDTFCSKRVHGFPPGVGAFLIMFNRFHNYVVTQLAKINERGRFTRPNKDDVEGLKKYDEDLFQTGRLITCGLYVNIILVDYVRTILNLNRTDSTWILDPRTQEGKSLLSKPIPEAVGNQVSVEFNLIYRWHSSMSEKDDRWTTKMMTDALGGKDPASASLPEVFRALGVFESQIADEPERRTFGGLRRQADGSFDDDALVKIVQDSIEDVAGSFGPNHVPACMRAIEILGMKQARGWNVATLNEFRSFIGLQRFATFEDINPDPKVAKLLAELYDSPDSVELYPGISAEEPKPFIVPGSGLCPPPTTGRAILSDAVALVRGDRFFTVDYTPRNLTNWGYSEVAVDKTVDNGHVMHKLFFRAFPNHFAQDSVYAHFPFVIPGENKKILDNLGLAVKYSWTPPQRKPSMQIIRSYKAAKSVLNDQSAFKVVWGEAIGFLSRQGSYNPTADFALAGDKPQNSASRTQVKACLFPASAWEQEVRQFYEATTWDLLRRHSIMVQDKGPRAELLTREVDVIRDVIGLAHARFMSAMFSLPLKVEGKEGGHYDDHAMFQTLMLIFAAVFWDSDVGKSFKLRQDARAAAQKLGGHILEHLKNESGSGSFSFKDHKATHGNGAAKTNGHSNGNGVRHKSVATPLLTSYGDSMLRRMLQGSGKSAEDTVWGSVLPLVMSGAANQTQLMAQCLDFYLSEKGQEHLPEMRRLANLDTREAFDKLMKYVLEGSRIRGAVALYRIAATDQSVDDNVPCVPNPADATFLSPIPNPGQVESEKKVSLPAGSRLLVDLTTASHDPSAFPDPETVRLDRNLDDYIHFGMGPHRCAGESISRVALTSIMKVLLKLDGLRRAEGNRGIFKSFPASQWPGQAERAVGEKPEWSGLRVYVSANESSFSPLPRSMRIRWDD